MNDIVPTNKVAKSGMAAVGGIGGGIVVAILGALSGLPWFIGVAAGALVGIVGLGALGSKDPGDKFPGVIATGAGALTIAANLPIIKSLLGGPARFFLGIGAFALIAVGIWNAIKFFKGMKSRS
jgi:hypothetical protein